MKRKMSTPTTNQVKKQSRTMMIKASENISESMDITNLDIKSRTFQFKLTDKTAKKNLLKSASRIPFENDPKQLCTMLKFSAGAFIQVVKPTIKFWESQNQKCFIYNNLNIKVDEFEDTDGRKQQTL